MPAVTKMREGETALKKAHMLVGGKWVESASGEWLEVEDPARRRPIAGVPRGRAEDVARAVKSAADAFPAWSRAVPRDRGRLLARIADALEARVEELARTIALETGNALCADRVPIESTHSMMR
jgi:acyl-CoA reductase-like NAD-dependent aldehyde dehydrogenase